MGAAKIDHSNFATLTFEGFRTLAASPDLSKYEKIGFPDAYRAGFERNIFADICAKLSNLDRRGLTVLDIGPGCSDLPILLIEHCRRNGHRLILVDSSEMLSHLPDADFIQKIPGMMPDCRSVLGTLVARVDALICYSVLQYIFAERNVFEFLDFAVSLLSPGGQMLLGDIPNWSKRSRFFASHAGMAFHERFVEENKVAPAVAHNPPTLSRIDDAVVLSLLLRARAAGADAYVLPQPASLPMANRREDILICRP